MIIKSKTRKNRSFKQAINYVLREEAQPLFVLTHNVEGTTPGSWLKSFQQNEEERRRNRKNTVKIIHIILSWHQRDTEKLTQDAMKEMSRQFMENYNPHAVYIAVGHPSERKVNRESDPNYAVYEDTEISSGSHVHLIIGGVDRFGRSLRLSKAQFQKVKQDAEDFQQERYPELKHSQINHEKLSHDRQTEAEYWLKRRSGKPTQKEQIQAILEQAYESAQSQEDFFGNIRVAGLETYTRGGKITGIRYGKYKHRLKYFGYTQERIKVLDERERMMSRSR